MYSECQSQLYCTIFLSDFTLRGTSEHKCTRVKCGMLHPKWPFALQDKGRHPKQVRLVNTGLSFHILMGICEMFA